MNELKPKERGYQSRIWASIQRLIGWGIGWVATCALMQFGPRFFWDKTSALTLLAIGLNVGVGIGLILAHKKYLAELDELQRRVYLNALAITVGVALIVSVPYTVMQRYEVVLFQANISHLWMLMSLTFVVSIFYGTWRYR